jgi:heavy metal sensor kinase
MIRSFRLQITAWYGLFFTALILVFSVTLYGVLARSLQTRFDELLSAEAGTAAALFQSELKELNGDARAAALEAVSEMRTPGVGIVIFNHEQLLASSEPADGNALRDVLTRTARAAQMTLALPHHGPYGSRAATHRLEAGGHPYLIAASASLQPVAAELELVRRVLYLTLPALLLAAGLGGFLMADRSLKPLQRMVEQARRITDRNLHSRLEIGRSTEELATLAATFNELLSRLDTSFGTMRRFMADASHELRTPISVIRGEADVSLAHDRPGAEYRESLAVIHDESKRLTRLVDDLLNLARADAGHVRLQVREFYLNDLLADCCRSVQTLASAKEIVVECRTGEDILFRGDEELLRRLVLNLLDNAIRYTPKQGRVSANVQIEDGLARISVCDTGIGIGPEAAAHVFERFYRGDAARSRQDGGFGLGLAIVRWIAESHNGSVELDSRQGAGTTFTVRLPQQPQFIVSS